MCNFCFCIHLLLQVYMAPEVLGDDPYHKSADIWSLAYVAPELRADREFAFEMVRWNGLAFRHLPAELRAERSRRGVARMTRRSNGFH